MTGFLRKTFVPQIDVPQPPPPPPAQTDEGQAAANEAANNEQQKSKGGRASTILTSGLGDTSEVSTSKRVLLGS